MRALSRATWTDQEDAILKQQYNAGASGTAIANQLGRRPSSIASRIGLLRQHGILKPRMMQVKAGTTRAAPISVRKECAGIPNWRGLDHAGWPEPGTVKMDPVWGFACRLYWQEQGIG